MHDLPTTAYLKVHRTAEGAGSSESQAKQTSTGVGGKVTVMDPQLAWTANKPMPRLKRPEELRELVRICSLPLAGMKGYTPPPFHPEEIAVQQVPSLEESCLKLRVYAALSC